MPRRKGPKRTWPDRKKQALRFFGSKRLSRNKRQRRQLRNTLGQKTVFEALLEKRGIPRSMATKAFRKSSSRYSIKARVQRGEPIFREQDVLKPAHWGKDNWGYDVWIGPRFEKEKVQIGVKPGEEQLILKRQKRKGGGGGGSSRGEGPVFKGTMKAKKSKSMRLGGTRGAFPGRETRKQAKPPKTE